MDKVIEVQKFARTPTSLDLEMDDGEGKTNEFGDTIVDELGVDPGEVVVDTLLREQLAAVLDSLKPARSTDHCQAFRALRRNALDAGSDRQGRGRDQGARRADQGQDARKVEGAGAVTAIGRLPSTNHN